MILITLFPFFSVTPISVSPGLTRSSHFPQNTLSFAPDGFCPIPSAVKVSRCPTHHSRLRARYPVESIWIIRSVSVSEHVACGDRRVGGDRLPSEEVGGCLDDVGIARGRGNLEAKAGVTCDGGDGCEGYYRIGESKAGN